jgi:hypothetical protein
MEQLHSGVRLVQFSGLSLSPERTNLTRHRMEVKAIRGQLCVLPEDARSFRRLLVAVERHGGFLPDTRQNECCIYG